MAALHFFYTKGHPCLAQLTHAVPPLAARLRWQAGAKGLFQGMSFWMGPGYKGTGVSPHQLTDLLTCTGGRVLERMPPRLTGVHPLLHSLSASFRSSHLAACVFQLTHSLHHSLTNPLTHPLTSLIDSPTFLTHSAHSPTHPLTHSLTHSLPHPHTHCL